MTVLDLPLHKRMGILVRTRLVRYRGLNSWQCVLLPVSEANGRDETVKIKHWPTKKDRLRKTAASAPAVPRQSSVVRISTDPVDGATLVPELTKEPA